MAPASAAASTAGRRTRASGAAARRGARPRVTRVRWARLARLAMLLVLCALVYLSVRAATHWVTTWRAAGGHRAQIALMERQNASLRARRTALLKTTTVEAEARRLGMVRPGERAYVIQDLPSN